MRKAYFADPKARAAAVQRARFSSSTSLTGFVGGAVLLIGAASSAAASSGQTTGLMSADVLANLPMPVNLVMPSGARNTAPLPSPIPEPDTAQAFATQALNNLGALDSATVPASPASPSGFESMVRSHIGDGQETGQFGGSVIGQTLNGLRAIPTTGDGTPAPAAFSAPQVGGASQGNPNARTGGTIQPVPAIDLRPVSLSSVPSPAFYERLRIDPPERNNYTVPLEPYRPFAPWLDVQPYLTLNDGDIRPGGAATLFAPLAQTGDSIVFSQLSAAYDTQRKFSASADIGYRKIHGPNFATGFNAGIGFDQSELSGVTQVRGTLGVEAKSRFFDFNLNGYFGETGENVSNAGGVVIPTAAATISSDFQTVFTPVTGKTYESGLSGVSSEVGLSLFDGYRAGGGRLGNLDFRVAGGGYYFDSLLNRDYDNRRGIFGKTELEWYNLNERYGQGTPRFAIGTESTYDDSTDQTNHNIFAKIRIPLHRVVNHPGNSLSRMGDRLIEPLQRVDYQYSTRYAGDTISTATASVITPNGTNGVASVAYASQSAAGFGSAAAGTASASATTIDNALGIVGTASVGNSNIVFLDDDCGSPTQGTLAGCSGLVTASATGAVMQPGTILVGGGESLTFIDPVLGSTVTVTNPGTGGTISGTGSNGVIAGTVLNTANDVWLKGVNITGGSDIGIHIDGDSGVVLQDVTVFDIVKSVSDDQSGTAGANASATGDVYGIKVDNASDVTFSNVTVRDIRAEIIATAGAGANGTVGTSGTAGTSTDPLTLLGTDGVLASPLQAATGAGYEYIDASNTVYSSPQTFIDGTSVSDADGYGANKLGAGSENLASNGVDGWTSANTAQLATLAGVNGGTGSATNGTFDAVNGDGTNGLNGGNAAATATAYGVVFDATANTATIDNLVIDGILAQATAIGGAGGDGGDGSAGALGADSTGGQGGVGAIGQIGGVGGRGLNGGRGFADTDNTTFATSQSGSGGDGSDAGNGGVGGTGGTGGQGGTGGKAGDGANGGDGGNGGTGGNATTVADAYGLIYDPANALVFNSITINDVLAEVISTAGAGGAAGAGGVGGAGGNTMGGIGGQGGRGGNGGAGGEGGLGGQGGTRYEQLANGGFDFDYLNGNGGDGGDGGFGGQGGDGGDGGDVLLADIGLGGSGGNGGIGGDAGQISETQNSWGLFLNGGGAVTTGVTFNSVTTSATTTAGLGGTAGAFGTAGKDGDATGGAGGDVGATGTNGAGGAGGSTVVNSGPSGNTATLGANGTDPGTPPVVGTGAQAGATGTVSGAGVSAGTTSVTGTVNAANSGSVGTAGAGTISVLGWITSIIGGGNSN